MAAAPPSGRAVLVSVSLAVVGLLLLAGGVRLLEDRPPDSGAASTPVADDAVPASAQPSAPESAAADPPAPAATPDALQAQQTPQRSRLPHGGRRIFEGNRFLVAYYGTGGTPAMGVLGETSPRVMHRRLVRAARPFRARGRPVTPVYELIVTVADATPGRDGDFNHDVDRAMVERYVRAARAQGALLLLDIQPGRSRFEDVARRWAWALRHPHVGLALDPEWRMRPGQVPARVIGSVTAAEVNRTSAWLARLRRAHDLPEKLFVLHQFRVSMIEDIDRVRRRHGLALVQHVDGFGTPGQKLDTYRTVQQARRFHMGLKLFYDEDVPRMSASDVQGIRPEVRFVSFQ